MFSLSRASNNLMRNKVIVETERAGLRGAVGQYIKLKSSVLVQDNESLANFACSSSTEEYWPSVVFVRTSIKCSLVWPSGWLEVMNCSYRGIHLLQ